MIFKQSFQPQAQPESKYQALQVMNVPSTGGI